VLPKSEKACFVIADISGYTKFLASSELEHAQDIIGDFMDTVVEALRPTFRLHLCSAHDLRRRLGPRL